MESEESENDEPQIPFIVPTQDNSTQMQKVETKDEQI